MAKRKYTCKDCTNFKQFYTGSKLVSYCQMKLQEAWAHHWDNKVSFVTLKSQTCDRFNLNPMMETV